MEQSIIQDNIEKAIKALPTTINNLEYYKQIGLNLMPRDSASDPLKNFLLNMLPYLSHYKCSGGYQGRAYMIHKNFVVKYFDAEKNYILTSLFDQFCNDVNRVKGEGVNIPQIYAWVKINPDSGLQNVRSGLYALIERVPGRNLFYESAEDMYSLVQDQIKQPLYMSAIASTIDYHDCSKIGGEVFEFIYGKILKDYITQTSKLIDMPKAGLEKLVDDIKSIVVNGTFCRQDVRGGNVLEDGKTLTLIDPYIKHNLFDDGFCKFGESVVPKGIDPRPYLAPGALIKSIVFLFYGLETINGDFDRVCKNYVKANRISTSAYDEFCNSKRELLGLVKTAITRFGSIASKSLTDEQKKQAIHLDHSIDFTRKLLTDIWSDCMGDVSLKDEHDQIIKSFGI